MSACFVFFFNNDRTDPAREILKSKFIFILISFLFSSHFCLNIVLKNVSQFAYFNFLVVIELVRVRSHEATLRLGFSIVVLLVGSYNARSAESKVMLQSKFCIFDLSLVCTAL